MQTKFIPLDIGPESVELFRCDGQVMSVKEFSADNLGILSRHEADFLKENLYLLAGPDGVPENFQNCMSRSSEIATDSNPVLTARRSGARSAFVHEANLQLKGCRPVLSGEKFPTEILPVNSTQVIRGQIPFGVMTAEAVLREVLGFCYMQKHGFPNQASPLAVTAYLYKKKPLGFGILLRLKSEIRVETHLVLPQATIRDLINMQTGCAPSMTDFLIGSELPLRGMNLWKYVEAKGRILAAMNWHGGFRGILNSNFGNDVLTSDGNDKHKLVLADFDTFCMIPVPDDSSSGSLDPFVLRCLLEVVMGSLPIMQYTNIAHDSPQEKVADALGAIYFQKSSLWRSYYRHFLSEAGARNIGTAAIGKSIERMRRTEAFTDILKSRILSDESIKRYEAERFFYYPHN